MKILLRRVDNLGDVVIIIPIIAALKQKFPGAYITAMVKPQHRDFLSGYADDFIKPVKSLKSIVGYDKIIDIDYKIPEGYIPKDLKKAKEISLGVKSFRRKRHISRQLYDHLKLHGIKTNFTSPLIHVDPKVNTKAKEWLIDKYINQNDFIITMDPGSNFTKKCWPIGYSIQKCLISIKPNDVADAVLASINRFIRSKSPEKFDHISLSPHLKIRKQKENILLKNKITGHRCLINRGWENINPVLEFIEAHQSFKKTERKFKDSKPLLDLFFVHRFIVPQGIAENGMYL